MMPRRGEPGSVEIDCILTTGCASSSPVRRAVSAGGQGGPMAATVSRAPVAIAVGVVLAVGMSAGPARSSVLCRNNRGGLLVRDTCKAREETLDPSKLDQLGLRGPAGPIGPVGPPGGGLKVLDATDAEVGLVTSLTTYYGQSASVVREMTLPGSSGPEFIAFSVTTQGLNT